MKKIFVLIVTGLTLFGFSNAENLWEMNKNESLKSCVSYFDGCNNCLVQDGNLLACTEIYCKKYEEPECKKYKINDEMKNLIDHLKGKIMYIGGSRYFDESSGEYNKKLMIKDIKNYNKLLKVEDLNNDLKDKIKFEIKKLKQRVIKYLKSKCEKNSGKFYVNSFDGKKVGICKLKNLKVCSQKDIFKGKCENKFTVKTRKIQNKVHDIFKEYFDGKAYKIEEKLVLAYKFLNKVDNLEDKKKSFKKYKKIVNYIEIPLKDYIKGYMKDFIYENIDELTSKEPVLGGNWYITKIDWIGIKKFKIYYEDGHITGNNIVNIKIKGGEIVY